MGKLKAFWAATKRVFAWIKANAAILLLSVGLLTISILIFCYDRRKIKELQLELNILKTKLKLEKLAVENAVEVEKLDELKEQDKKLQEQVQKIKEDLKQTLPEDMSEEEIAKMFAELGLRSK